MVTGAFMPTVLRQPDEPERLVYTGFWKGSFDLYVTETGEPVTEPQTVQIPVEPATAAEHDATSSRTSRSPSTPPTRSPTAAASSSSRTPQTIVGVNSDQTYLGQILLTFSDYLGDRRIFATVSSIDSFSNFDILYADLSRRLQWQVHLFDDRTFYLYRAIPSPAGSTNGASAFQSPAPSARSSTRFSFYHAGRGRGRLPLPRRTWSPSRTS